MVGKLNVISHSRVTLRAYSVKAAIMEVSLVMSEKNSCDIRRDYSVEAVLIRTSRVRT